MRLYLLLALLLLAPAAPAGAAELDYEGGSFRHILRLLAREMDLRTAIVDREVPWDAAVSIIYTGPAREALPEVVARVRGDLAWKIDGDRLVVGVPGTDFFDFPPPPPEGPTERLLLGERLPAELVADLLGERFPDVEMWTDEAWNELDLRGRPSEIRAVKNTFPCGFVGYAALVRARRGLDTSGLGDVEVRFDPRYNFYSLWSEDRAAVERAAEVLRSR